MGGAVGGGFGGAAAGAGAGAATGGLIGGAGYASAGYGTFWQGFTQGAISGAISGGFAGFNAVSKTPTPEDVAEALKNAPDYEVAYNEGPGTIGDPQNWLSTEPGGNYNTCMLGAVALTVNCRFFAPVPKPACFGVSEVMAATCGLLK